MYVIVCKLSLNQVVFKVSLLYLLNTYSKQNQVLVYILDFKKKRREKRKAGDKKIEYRSISGRFEIVKWGESEIVIWFVYFYLRVFCVLRNTKTLQLFLPSEFSFPWVILCTNFIS